VDAVIIVIQTVGFGGLDFVIPIEKLHPERVYFSDGRRW
jgi:hypothetical protein